MNNQRRFLPLGQVQERTTKAGTPYLTGMIAGHQVFLFPQADGSWNVFTPAEESSVSVRQPSPEHLTDQAGYEQTLAGVTVPDYDEPVRRSHAQTRRSRRSTAAD